MNLNYGIYQPLRFYETLQHQVRRQDGGSMRAFELICPKAHLLPFQIKRPRSPLDIQRFELVAADGGTSGYDLLGDPVSRGEIKIYNFDTYDQIVYFGNNGYSASLMGDYYCVVSDGQNTWYSEILTFKSFDANMTGMFANDCVLTKITYWDTCDVADIFYRTTDQGDPQYKNILYLDTGIGRPAYEYTEEGDEDGEGVFFAEYKKLEKQYLVQGVFPEFFLDALSVIPLHVSQDESKGVVLVQTNMGYSSAVDTFSVDADWQGTKGVFALTDLVFSTNFITKFGCCAASVEQLTTMCIRTAVRAEALIFENSQNYLDGKYQDEDGNDVILQSGQKILCIISIDNFQLRTYLGNGQYEADYSLPKGGSVWIKDQLDRRATPMTTYYFVETTAGAPLKNQPRVLYEDQLDDDVNIRLMHGVGYADSLVQIFTYGNYGDSLVKTGSGQDFVTTGIQYEVPPGSTGFYVRFQGIGCELGETPATPYPQEDLPFVGSGGSSGRGVGYDAVGSTNVVG